MNEKNIKGKKIKTVIAAALVSASLAAGFAMPVSAAPQYVEVTGNPVNIRSDAGYSASVLAKAHKGDKYACVAEKTDSDGKKWYQIQYTDSKTGWITAEYAKSASASKQVVIIGDANVRSDAGASYTKLGVAKKGKTYKYLDSKKASNGHIWYKIQYTSNKTGWVASGYSKLTDGTATTTTTTTKQVVITGDANVRSDAGASYTKLGVAKKGKTYKYLDSKKASNGKTWYKIQYTSNKTGWVSSGYSKVQTVQATKQVVITGDANVRSDAGASYTKLGVAKKGTTYKYLDSKKASNGKTWYKIQYTSNKTGWVVSGYSKIVTK